MPVPRAPTLFAYLSQPAIDCLLLRGAPARKAMAVHLLVLGDEGLAVIVVDPVEGLIHVAVKEMRCGGVFLPDTTRGLSYRQLPLCNYQRRLLCCSDVADPINPGAVVSSASVIVPIPRVCQHEL